MIANRYELLEVLGQGGMGVVHRAQDTVLKREVALKLLNLSVHQGAEAVKRFQREVEIITQLEHAHIVPIYDVGDHQGQPFLVMRWLKGGSLRDQLTAGKLSQKVLCRALGQVAQALDMAHTKQVIHRDIKPTNILFDEQGMAFVSDFGIAKVLDATTQLTGSAILGSPAYMSPEQFTGRGMNGRSDQYNLAVVAFEAFAGKLPFIGDTMQMMYQHLQETPPPVHTCNHDLPGSLSLVLARALAKKPEERFDSVSAFVEAVTTAVTHNEYQPAKVVSNPPPSKKQTAPTPQQRMLAKDIPRPSVPTRSTSSRINRPIIGAGGTPLPKAKSPLSWRVGIGVIVLSLVMVAGYFLSQSEQPLEPTVTNQILATPIKPLVTPTITAVTALQITSVPVIWNPKNNQDAVSLLFVPGETLMIQAKQDGEELTLPNGEVVFLAAGTAVDLVQIAGINAAEETQFVLQSGILVVQSQNIPVVVKNIFGAIGKVEQGVMGVQFTANPFKFQVACLNGQCHLLGDIEGVLDLGGGEASFVGGSGRPEAIAVIDYQVYALIAHIVPTPTKTPRATATFTKTPTYTPMATRIPTTRIPTATITNTPFSVPTSLPFNPTSPPVNTPIPFQPDTPVPPPDTPTPEPYVPPTPRPTTIPPTAYPYP